MVDQHETQQQSAQSQQSAPPVSGGSGRSNKSWCAKVAIVIGASAVALPILGILMLTLLYKSCDAMLFGTHEPNDSAALKTFVGFADVVERDLEIFDTLRTGFEGVYLDKSEEELVEAGVVDERPLCQSRRQLRAEAAAYVDAFRKKLEAGTWPTDDPVFLGPDDESSPQLWVRIAGLAEMHIEGGTGEDWQILSFSYPYPRGTGGRFFFLRGHGPGDLLVTSLECMTGPNAGLRVDVSYARWSHDGKTLSNYETCLATLQNRREQGALVGESGLLDGRQYAMDGPHQRIYVWSSGEDDSMRNPENFTRTLNELSEATDMESLELVLLEEDAPAFLSREFPSELNSFDELEVVQAEDVPEAVLMDMCKADSFLFAPADVLLQQAIGPDVSRGEATLHGSLLLDENDPFYNWYPFYRVEVDAGLSAYVTEQLGLADAQAIALLGADDYGSREIDVILPRGVLAETPDSVEEATKNLQRALWERALAAGEVEDCDKIYLNLHVVDSDSVIGPEGASTLARLHSTVMADAQALSSYNAPCVLHAMLASSIYVDEGESVMDSRVSDYGVSVDGPLTESRAWYLALAEEC